jgi:DNA-binding response OmpR family regulator
MRTVWVVDDDKAMCEAIRLMLEMLGFNVVVFNDARSAAQVLLSGSRPAMMFLDIQMPQVSGIDMLEFMRTREDFKTVPVVMLSSETTDVQVEQALSLGANGYAFKPVTLDEMEAVIASVLDQEQSASA